MKALQNVSAPAGARSGGAARPAYRLVRRYSVVVRAPADTVAAVLSRLEPAALPSVRLLYAVRGLPRRLPLVRRAAGEAARAVLALRVEPIDFQTTRVAVETRVQASGRAAATRLRAYWWVFAPLTALVRGRLLRRVKARAEQDAGLFLLTP